MAQITYLIGAGASFKALPIVNQIPGRYKDFLTTLHKLIQDTYNREPLNVTLSASPEEQADPLFFESLFNSLLWKFRPGIESHASVDTYAKKLYLTRDEDLKYYKFCLSAFLAFEKIVRGPDKRYDTFFASILREGIHDFPQNLNILSWNYDTQFQIAYSNYSRDDRMHAAKESLNIINKNSNENFLKFENDFCIVKLNGTIGAMGSDGNHMAYIHDRCYGDCKNFDIGDFKAMTKTFKEFVTSNSVSSTMSFAWEESWNTEFTIIEKAKRVASKTEVLVIIGYSFPFFNRKVDGAIFDSMKNLNKIYIQDPNAKSMVQSVQELCSTNEFRGMPDIIPYENVDQFLIPRELD